jgi:hypothetical protein
VTVGFLFTKESLESLVAQFLRTRLEHLTASPPAPKAVRKSAAEIYYILAARELLDQPFKVSGRARSKMRVLILKAVSEGAGLFMSQFPGSGW